MTTAVRTPELHAAPGSGILSVECELTSRCQLECQHCCTMSSPKVSHGSMALDDWRQVVDDIAALGIPAVQFIGGEPTLSLNLIPLINHALCRGLEVEVYSNLTHIRPGLWAALEQHGVRLATSYYSDDPAQHNTITKGRGSHGRTLANIKEAMSRQIPLRVGIVTVLEDQRVDQAMAELRELGVERIQVDRTRKVGRAAEESGTITNVSELCGRCFHNRVAVSPDGDVYGCILSRFMPTGNVRTRLLRDVLSGERWAEARAAVPLPMTNGCPPDDSGDCDPANTPACDPAYGYAPRPVGAVS
ncbi:radical SAM protein [Streptomyces sp. NPDC005407]|uniref:radical SAM protein n=1 Tax=Streptomyces sp. NPDC005407 TaxID=3155340 RepID=UPI0033BDEC5F